METLNELTIFISGIALGIIIGHQLYKRLESKLDYLRGRSDGANELWPHLVNAWKENMRLKYFSNTGTQTDGGADSNEKTVR